MLLALYTLGIRHAIGWVLLSSAVDKLLFPGDAKRAMSPLVPSQAIPFAAATLAVLELLLALSMLLGVYWRVGGALASMLLIALMIALAFTAIGAGPNSCGCGGFFRRIKGRREHLTISATLAIASVSIAFFSKTYGAVANWSLFDGTQALGMTGTAWLLVIGVPIALGAVQISGFMRENWGSILAVARSRADAGRRTGGVALAPARTAKERSPNA